MEAGAPRLSVRAAVVDDLALGTTVRLVVTRPAGMKAAKSALDAVLSRIDAACSHFRQDSELSRLNARAGQEVHISPLLAAALAAALRAARLSGGAVDPTAGRGLRLARAGFDTAPAGGALWLTGPAAAGWRRVRFDLGRRLVRLPADVELALDPTARALAADMAAGAALRAAGGGGALVGLGADVAVAGEPPAGGWLVPVDADSGAPFLAGAETVAVLAGGLATSGTAAGRGRGDGVELRHVLDPSTGAPAQSPWRAASVLAGSCVDAGIAGTAAVVRGRGAPGWLAMLGLPSRLVDRQGRVVRVGGWPQPMSAPS